MRSSSAFFVIAATLINNSTYANNEEYECISEKPTAGILNAQKLQNFKSREDEFKFYETAYLVDEPKIRVSVEAGGCAHYIVDLTFTFDDKEPLSNKAHYVEVVRNLLDKTPFKEDTLYWKTEFLQALDKNKNDPKAEETGTYVLQPSYSTVYLTTTREGQSVSLSISQDISL